LDAEVESTERQLNEFVQAHAEQLRGTKFDATTQDKAVSACAHPSLEVSGDPRVSEFVVSCPGCFTSWDHDGPDLPADVERRALPIWQRNGL
jgi:hypothetical protein